MYIDDSQDNLIRKIFYILNDLTIGNTKQKHLK